MATREHYDDDARDYDDAYPDDDDIVVAGKGARKGGGGGGRARPNNAAAHAHGSCYSAKHVRAIEARVAMTVAGRR